jgi:hypothetical protein
MLQVTTEYSVAISLIGVSIKKRAGSNRNEVLSVVSPRSAVTVSPNASKQAAAYPSRTGPEDRDQAVTERVRVATNDEMG